MTPLAAIRAGASGHSVIDEGARGIEDTKETGELTIFGAVIAPAESGRPARSACLARARRTRSRCHLSARLDARRQLLPAQWRWALNFSEHQFSPTGHKRDTISCALSYQVLEIGHVLLRELANFAPHQGDEPPLSAASLATLRYWASERRRLRGDGLAGPHDRFELDAHNSSVIRAGSPKVSFKSRRPIGSREAQLPELCHCIIMVTPPTAADTSAPTFGPLSCRMTPFAF